MTRSHLLAAMLVVCGSLFGCGSGADKDDYVAENMRLLEEFGSPPWAHQLNMTQNGYRRQTQADCELPPFIASSDCDFVGYSTQVLYETDPDKTPREVVDFYVEQADASWSPAIEENEYISDSIEYVARFTRGDAEVVVATGARTAGGPEAYWVTLDHDTSH